MLAARLSISCCVQNVFYAWHWYGAPKSVDAAIANVQGVMNDWNVPSFATEFMSCDVWNAAAAANISHSYWHYSCYCNTGKDFGNRKVTHKSVLYHSI